jgi:hypothetical protein
MRARTACCSLVSLLVSMFLTQGASAFCRTTTCDSQMEECDRDASGCVITGLPLYWPGECVGFDMQQDASIKVGLPDATRAAEAAFATWMNARCTSTSTPSVEIRDLGPVVCDKVEYTSDGDASTGQGNANIIVFRDQNWPHPDSLDRTLALTTVTFSETTGEIYDAAMEFNGDQALSTSTPPPSGGYAVTPSFRGRSAYDIAAICTVYPSDRAGTSCNNATPRHGFNSACAVPLPDNNGGCGCRTSALAHAPGTGNYATPCAGLLGFVLFWRSRFWRTRRSHRTPINP